MAFLKHNAAQSAGEATRIGTGENDPRDCQLASERFALGFEIKCSRADLLGDQKWPEYLEYCDRFFWAVPAGFDIGPLHSEAFMPERAGLIIADAYDAEIARPAALVPVLPARRKTETQRLARLAMRRLMGIADPDLMLAEIDVE